MERFGSFLNENLRKVYGDLTFSDLHLPLKIAATDLLTGERVILSGGSIFDAIRASLAIPIIFPPWEVNGRLLIDGAASNPLPIDVAIQDSADIIVAMGFTLDYRSRFRSMTAVQEQLNNIYMNNILTSTYAFYNLAHHAEIFPIIPEFDEALSMFDVDKIPEIIERGKQETRKQLPHIKRLMTDCRREFFRARKKEGTPVLKQKRLTGVFSLAVPPRESVPNYTLPYF